MARKLKGNKVKNVERKFGTQGSIWVRNITGNDGELNSKGRVFAHTTVLLHSGIWYNIHNLTFEDGNQTKSL